MLCMGYSSKVKNKHIMMLDIDRCTKRQAENIAGRIIANEKTSDIYIIESSPNKHHLICLDIFSWKNVLKIIKNFADSEWLKYRSKTRNFILRFSKKKTMPKMKSCVKGINRRRKSNAHRLLLQAIYKINIPKDKYFDKGSKIEVHIYETRGG